MHASSSVLPLPSIPFPEVTPVSVSAPSPAGPAQRRLRTVVAALAGAAMVMSASMLSPSAGSLLRPAEASAAADKAASEDVRNEVERLVAHISETWKTPLAATQRIVEAAFSQAQAQGISPTLILAVVAQESSFRNTARSGYGAQGLMQVSARHHPDKLKGLGSDALYRTETNIRVGTQVLAEYLERNNGRLDPALRKYSGNASSYPRKIRAFWNQLEQVRRTDAIDGTRLARAG